MDAHTRALLGYLSSLFQNGVVVSSALRQTSFERGVARELVVVLSASDNMAVYRCNAKNEAKSTISAQIRLRVYCESDGTSQSTVTFDISTFVSSF